MTAITYPNSLLWISARYIANNVSKCSKYGYEGKDFGMLPRHLKHRILKVIMTTNRFQYTRRYIKAVVSLIDPCTELRLVVDVISRLIIDHDHNGYYDDFLRKLPVNVKDELLKRITDPGRNHLLIQEFAQSVVALLHPDVKEISIKKGSYLLDDDFLAEFDKCTRLETATFQFLGKVTKEGWINFLRRKPHLKIIRFSSCRNVDIDVCRFVEKNCPNLEVFDCFPRSWIVL